MNKSILSIFGALSIFASTLSASNVYATVNGDNVTNEDVTMALRNPNVSFETLPKESRTRLLNQLIDRKLLSQEASKSDIKSSKEYKKALESIKSNLAFELWMQKKIKSMKISKNDKMTFYKKNSSKFKNDAKLTASHILLKDEKSAKEVISILNKVKNKKAKFIELAKKRSTGPTGAKGGSLGEFSAGQMVPAFSKAAMDLKVGSYTKSPVKTQFGYHVIYLENKKVASTKSFKDVEAQITKNLLQKKIGEFVVSKTSELRKKAKIVIK